MWDPHPLMAVELTQACTAPAAESIMQHRLRVLAAPQVGTRQQQQVLQLQMSPAEARLQGWDRTGSIRHSCKRSMLGQAARCASRAWLAQA